MKNNQYYHVLVILTVMVWGTTFVSTKILLNNGLTPPAIFVYRFLIAFVLICFFAPKKLWADSKKDELLFLGAGLTGGSLYFLTENTALGITLASNVALILCTTPLLTALCSHFMVKGERLRKQFIYGGMISLVGVAFVVFNGHFVLKITPLGDLLTITAALMWAFYNVIIKRLDKRYDIFFITKKVFIYGLLTILPVFIFTPFGFDTETLLRPAVIGNLLFLSVIASMLCFLTWNIAVKHLGSINTAKYLYITPIVTLITSAIVINEPVTPIALFGAVLILGGIYLCDR